MKAAFGSLWTPFSYMMVTLWQLWGHFVVTIGIRGRLCGQFGVTLGALATCWSAFGVTLGSVWVSVGDFRSLDDYFGTIAESLWVY